MIVKPQVLKPNRGMINENVNEIIHYVSKHHKAYTVKYNTLTENGVVSPTNRYEAFFSDNP